MVSKIIAKPIELVQDDIDYLKDRAAQCLRDMSNTKDFEEKRRLYLMYEAYWDLYEQNRDKVEK